VRGKVTDKSVGCITAGSCIITAVTDRRRVMSLARPGVKSEWEIGRCRVRISRKAFCTPLLSGSSFPRHCFDPRQIFLAPSLLHSNLSNPFQNSTNDGSRLLCLSWRVVEPLEGKDSLGRKIGRFVTCLSRCSCRLGRGRPVLC
jgi:hypothetical protein